MDQKNLNGGGDLRIIRNFSVKTELDNSESVVLKATNNLVCKGSAITVLLDEDGSSLGSYEAALQGKETVDRFTLESNGNRFDPHEIFSVGFSEQFPECCSVSDYLKKIGLSDAETKAALDFYDLNKISYLYCAQVPTTAARQLWLLTALKSPARVLLLRDPFAPFSGRWRESFANMFMKESQEKGRTLICTNVSFMPQAWGTNQSIRSIDVGNLAYSAAKKAKMEEEAKRQGETVVKAAVDSQVVNAPVKENTEQASDPKVKIEIPENLNFAYQATYDYIFQPLVDISQFFRRYTLVTGVFAFALVMATMGTMMVPNLGKLRAKLQTMHFDISWKDIREAMRSTPEQPKVAENSDQQESGDLHPSDEVAVDENEVIVENLGEDSSSEDYSWINNFEPVEPEVSRINSIEEDPALLISIDDKFACPIA